MYLVPTVLVLLQKLVSLEQTQHEVGMYGGASTTYIVMFVDDGIVHKLTMSTI